MNFIRKILLKRTLRKVGNATIRQLQSDIQSGARYPHIASGTLLNSFKFEIEEKGDLLTLKLIADESYDFIEDGRKAGTFVPVAPLQQWMQAKGIPLEDSYKINVAIKRQGITPKRYLQDYLSREDDKLLQTLAKALQGDMEKALSSALKTKR